MTSRVVSRSPRCTAVTQTQYNKNTMETNPFYVLRHKKYYVINLVAVSIKLFFPDPKFRTESTVIEYIVRICIITILHDFTLHFYEL